MVQQQWLQLKMKLLGYNMKIDISGGINIWWGSIKMIW